VQASACQPTSSAWLRFWEYRHFVSDVDGFVATTQRVEFCHEDLGFVGMAARYGTVGHGVVICEAKEQGLWAVKAQFHRISIVNALARLKEHNSP
jgi:hypothetical protein